MRSWKFTDFQPKWSSNAEDHAILADMPDVGHYPEPVPSVSTRLKPASGRSAVSASTLSEAITIKQRIFNYAAYDVVRGVIPSFSDLRKIDDVCLELGRLEFEPFEEGSFVIPAELVSEPISVVIDGVGRTFKPVDVLNRFNEVLAGLRQISINTSVSIGMLAEIASLGKLLKREVSSLEFSTLSPPQVGDLTATRSMRHSIDEDYLSRVSQIRKMRQHEQVNSGDTLTGTLVAVDFETYKLRIILDSEQHATVTGSFLPLIEGDIMACMRKRAKFLGQVRYRDAVPRTIEVVEAKPL